MPTRKTLTSTASLQGSVFRKYIGFPALYVYERAGIDWKCDLLLFVALSHESVLTRQRR